VGKDDIPLDPEKGLDPHMCYCMRCGNDTNSLTVGALRKATLSDGRVVYAQRGAGQRKTRADLHKQGINERLEWKELDEREKVPDPNFCDSCREELQKWADIVREGGVYFRCKECSANGVIYGDTDVARATRESLDVQAPDPCGFEFSSCEQHENLVEDE
jgi:hypothetical protein